MVKFAGIAIVWAKKDIFKVKDTFQSYKEIKEIKFTHLGKKVKKLLKLPKNKKNGLKTT